MRKVSVFVIGVLVGIVFAIPLQAVAENLSKVGKRVETEVPVSVDGEILKTPAIGLEGTTYLPVRDVGERFGYEVEYDSELKVVTLNSKVIDRTETKDSYTEGLKLELEAYADKLKGQTREDLKVALDGWEGRLPTDQYRLEAAKFMYDKDPSEENKKFLDDMLAQLEETQQRIEIIKQALSELEAQQQ